MCMRVTANVAVGLKHGDVMIFVQVVRKCVASDATAYYCNFHKIISKMYFLGALQRCAVLKILMYYVYIPVSALRAPCIASQNPTFSEIIFIFNF